MDRPHVASTQHLQPRGVERTRATPIVDRRPRCSARSERISQPSPPGSRCAGSAAQESAQHAALGVVDPVLERRARPRGNPGRVAHDERRPPFGKEIRLHDLHLLRQPEALEVLARARQRAGILIGGDHASYAAPREHRRQHAGPRADVEGHGRTTTAPAGSGALRDEVDVFAANRREHAVVRMDPAADRGDIDSLDAPLVRADEAQQLPQRGDRGSVSRRPRLPRRPAGCRARVATECHSPASSGTSSMPSVRARCDRAWRSRLNASAGEKVSRMRAAFFGLRDWRSARLASAISICRAFWKSPRHRSAVPWHARPYACVGRHAVIGDDHVASAAAPRAPSASVRNSPRRPRSSERPGAAASYSSVYFLLFPRALSTGYFSAFATSLRWAAAIGSMPNWSQSRMR